MTVVLKIGGARAVDPAGALADVATLSDSHDIAIVHGGSTAVDETLERLGIEPEYVETPSGVIGRFTDDETIKVFQMVMPGLVNTQLVAGLQSEGVNAVGLSGVDGKLLSGPRKSAVRVVEDGKRKIRRGDHSGSLKRVNAELLETLLADGYTPVASPPMAGEESDGSVTPVNTDADRAAAAVAGALGATLVILTDVPGILADPEDETTLIERVETSEDWQTMETAAEGFMGRKVMAIREALESGAPRAVVADANAAEPVVSALEGNGTHVHSSAISHEGNNTSAPDDEGTSSTTGGAEQ